MIYLILNRSTKLGTSTIMVVFDYIYLKKFHINIASPQEVSKPHQK